MLRFQQTAALGRSQNQHALLDELLEVLGGVAGAGRHGFESLGVLLLLFEQSESPALPSLVQLVAALHQFLCALLVTVALLLDLVDSLDELFETNFGDALLLVGDLIPPTQ